MPKKRHSANASTQKVMPTASPNSLPGQPNGSANYPPRDSEEWRAKNARAKEIIMSTLVPGSEPWKIAEPLELASDIWKALEDRYAPKNQGKQRQSSPSPSPQKSDVEMIKGDVAAAGQDDEKGARLERKMSKGTAQAGNTEREQKPAAETEKNVRDGQTDRKKEAQAAAAKILVEHMPNRDQRFLWALLHGGKEETMAWFNGTNVTT